MARKSSRARRGAHAYLSGVLSVHASGYGFVRSSVGEFFIPEKKMNGAMDGDLVELSVLPKQEQNGRRRSDNHDKMESRAARIVRVVERAHTCIIGHFEKAEPFGVVVPLDYRLKHDIFVRLEDAAHVPDGALVKVRMLTFPSHREAATGIIEEVLDTQSTNMAQIDALLDHHHIETVFSDACLELAKSMKLDVHEALKEGYRDIRDRFICTIDPVDAKDFDDALSLCMISDIDSSELPDAVRGTSACWRLGVHIADVSRYVSWDSSIDLDARRRATSIYLVDRVIPMLPEELSNDLCSLKPNETRCSMTIDLYLDKTAAVVYKEIYPALIESCQRLHYGQVQELLEGNEAFFVSQLTLACEKKTQCVWQLRELANIAELLDKRRRSKGASQFETTEAKVKLAEDGTALAIELRKKTQATMLVEEAMILANEEVANYLIEQGIPGVYRVHEKPLADDMASLVPVFEEFSWWETIDKKKFLQAQPFQVQKIVDAVKGRLEEPLVTSLLLRSMSRAVYRPIVADHYGLVSSAYLHFTSPIRRYPDLIVHRMLKFHWKNTRGSLSSGDTKAFNKETKQLTWLAEHSSKMEQLAEKVAGESQEIKIVEYMQNYEGEQFDALISGVAHYGIYVKLNNTAEGFIPLRYLGQEYFTFDPLKRRLTGEDSDTVYSLGQKLSVVLRNADVKTRSMEFRLA